MARAVALLCGLALAGLPSPALAHLVDVRFGEFYGGALHLVTGLQYALLLVALWMLGAAPLGILIGAAAAVAVPGGSASLAVTVGVGVVALVAAAGHRLPTAGLIAVGAAAALLLGYENGLAITAQSDVLLFLSGLTMAGLVVVCLLTAGLHRLADLAAWPRIAMRAVASWIAAVSLILVALALQTPAQAG